MNKMNGNLDDLFKKALKGKVFELKYELNIGGEKVPVKIRSIAQRNIGKRQVYNFESELANGIKKGLDKVPFNTKEWENHLSQLKDEKLRERRALTPPESRAHQLAETFSMTETILSLVPENLLNPDNSQFLETDEQKERFREMIDNDTELFGQMFTIYIDLHKKQEKIEETAKN